MANVNRVNLHVSNIEMCNAMLDATTTFIDNLMENLDDVTKYSFAVDLMNHLDDLIQTCYDTADDASQAVIDYLDNINWDYGQLEGYRAYSKMMGTYLHGANDVPAMLNPVDEDTEGEDVANVFGIKNVAKDLTVAPDVIDKALPGQLHYPNDYENEEALAKGMTRLPISVFPPFTEDGKPPVKPAPVSDPAEERKKARAAYLAAMKQNTSQPT